MSLMLRLQIGAILIAVLTGAFVIDASASAAPPAGVAVAATSYGLFILWWIGSAAIIRYRGIVDDTPEGWYQHTIRVFWLGNATSLIFIWLILPFVEEDLQLVTALFTLGPTVVEVMGTVRSPRLGPQGRAAILAPMAIPAGMVLFLLVHGGKWAIPVAAFIAAVTGILLVLRRYLQKALSDAEAAQRQAELERDARVRFLASASHDLGQPLQSARLFVDRAMRDPKPAARATAGRSAQAALGAMERLLRQMLDHLRFDAGSISPKIRDVPVAGLLAEVMAQFEPIAEISEVELRMVASTAVIRADADLAERAIANLVDNALRHSGARRVLMGLTRRSGVARIWVIDDGTGISPANTPGLFQEFVQGQWQDDREHGGFGLGLASARRYGHVMGASVDLDPRWRRGAAFFLELPLAAGLVR